MVSEYKIHYVTSRGNTLAGSLQCAATTAQKVKEDMITAPDVAREIGVERRADARKSVLSAAARLARRERRLSRRLQRLDEQIAGQSIDV